MMLRALAIVVSAGIVWTTAAGRAAEQVRLPVGEVVRGATLVQPFGCTTLELEPFDPYCPTRHFHSGVDLAAPAGTPVYAATDGLVVTGFDPRGAGLFVAIAFGSHVRLVYCHLSSAALTSGDRISDGGLVGRVGATGLATGPHLHLEVQVDGRSVDPVRWLSAASP